MKKQASEALTHHTCVAVALATVVACALSMPLRAQDLTEFERIPWEHGPTVVKVGDQATIKLPSGFRFTHEAGAKKFMELSENPPSGRELAILAPEDLSWFVILRFIDDGYVSDTEKRSLDSDALLSSIQRATEKSNEERKRRGWGTITVIDWIQSPYYDAATHNLEWSIRGRDERGELVANHFTRFLGRRGVMTADIVAMIDTLNSDLLAFRQTMKGFSFTPENSYLAFVSGDKVAKYGLTGLIVGGVAAKTGILKYLWKLIVAAVVAVGALLKRLFSPRRDNQYYR
jgi:uncharacterized membrane-anchored protein